MRTWRIWRIFGRAGGAEGKEFNAEGRGEETQRAQRRRGSRENFSTRMIGVLIGLPGGACGFGFDFANFVHSGAQTGFEALVSRFVVGAGGKVVWEAGHVGEIRKIKSDRKSTRLNSSH